MIPAEEALAAAQPRSRAVAEPKKLTDDEVIALNYLDYTLEHGIFTNFNGEPLEIKIPANIAKSADVIAAIKRRYEEGRWTVGVFPIVDGDFVTAFQLVFCPKEVAVAPVKPAPLPVVVSSVAQTQFGKNDPRIVVRFPTRGRPAQAIEVLSRYVGMAGMPIRVEVVVDTDDETVDSPFLYRLHALGCTVTFGEHKSKIEACNGGRLTDWDIIVLGSDDMVPVKDGWARRIAELFEEHWAYYDGCIHLDDGYAHDRVATLSVMGRRYYEMMSGRNIYHPSYRSVFCDDHYTEMARAQNRIVYVPEVLIEHRHPAAGKAKQDALYARNDALWKADEETYKNYQRVGVFEWKPLLSVLICTYPARREMLERLMCEFDRQTERGLRDKVEILVDHKPADSLGAKRQRLLDRSRGQYVCFVDDDDMVAHNYLARVISALMSDRNADCASFVGVMTTNGDRPERFEHSLKYDRWATLENGLHVRNPNHLNAVRRSIAVEAGFGDLTYCEDHFYSKAILPRLKKEVSTGDTPLYWYFFRKKDSFSGAVK